MSKRHKTVLSQPTPSTQLFPIEANKGPGPMSKPVDDMDRELDIIGVFPSPMVTDGSTYKCSSTPSSNFISEPDGTDLSDAHKLIIKKGKNCNAEDTCKGGEGS